MAVDIGTTTVVGYLCDLVNGQFRAVDASLNEQQIHGADVITRIDYAMNEPQGLDRLRELVLSTINGIIERICKREGLSPHSIYSLVTVGNTTMNQLFWGISSQLLCRAPYNPISLEALSTSAKGLGLQINPLGMVFSLPLVAGFLGSDTVGVVLSTGLHKSKSPRIAMDIGTNGEIVVNDGKRMVACSCAAGPAFEGAHIQCGMRGCSGAIDRVDFKDGQVTYHVIDQVPPQGICGSGLVDAVAALLDAGLITKDGRLLTRQEAGGSPYAERLSEDPYNQFLLTEKDPLPGSRPVAVTQKDIREVQLAKGAMLAGVWILLEILGLGTEDVREVYLAGAFGNYVRAQSVMRIGLLPTFPRAIIRQVGNAAGSGAKMALLSQSAFKEAKRIADHIEYIDLARAADFQQQFVKGMVFPR
ncbi:MAG TPA: ASKHA domain-containing protein [Nitrospirota bacterium]|nr:ASKHA domain-containing protein [Nitrospirota bacterium]